MMTDEQQQDTERDYTPIEGVVFDFGAITMDDHLTLLDAMGPAVANRRAFDAYSAVFTKVIVKCPWGDPASADTYKQVHPFIEWPILTRMYWSEANALQKKAMQPPTPA